MKNKRIFLKRRREKRRIRGFYNKSIYPSVGLFCIKSAETGYLTSKQIESVRRLISRKTKRLSRVWINKVLDKSLTKKASGSRMGKGKGKVIYKISRVYKGQIIYEINGISLNLMRDVFNSIKYKLPLKIVLINN